MPVEGISKEDYVDQAVPYQFHGHSQYIQAASAAWDAGVPFATTFQNLNAIADQMGAYYTFTSLNRPAGAPEPAPAPADTGGAGGSAAEIAARFQEEYPTFTFVGIDPATGNVVARNAEGKTAVFSPAGDTFIRAAGGTEDPKFGAETGGGGARGFAPQAVSVDTDPVTGEILWIDPNTRTVSRSGQFVGIAPKQIIDPRSGRLLVVTPDGQVTDTGQQVGFPDIDPAVTAAEQTRQFDAGEAGETDRTNIREAGATGRTQMTETGSNQRAGLNAQVQGFQSINQLAPQLGQLALNNATFTSDTLRQPQDFVARAFTSRGQTSPFPEVSQADVINKLRENIAGFNTALAGFQGFNPTVAAPTTAPVQAAAAVAPPPAAAPVPPSALNAQGNLDADAIRQGAVWRPTPGFAQGGFTHAPMMIVGEEGPELIANPHRGPLAIADAETTEKMGFKGPGFAMGTRDSMSENKTDLPLDPWWEGYRAGMSPFPPNQTDPQFMSGYNAGRRQRIMSEDTTPRPPAGFDAERSAVIPHYASGTGWLGALNAAQEAMNDPGRQAAIVGAANTSAWGGSPGFASTQADAFDDDYNPPPPPPPPPVVPPVVPPVAPPVAPVMFQPPQLPVGPAVTQAGLQSAEKLARPPAVNDVLSGRSPSPLRFKNTLFTPIQYEQLTKDERTALGVSLALDNESLADYETGMRQRFLPPTGRGQAAFVGGFR